FATWTLTFARVIEQCGHPQRTAWRTTGARQEIVVRVRFRARSHAAQLSQPLHAHLETASPCARDNQRAQSRSCTRQLTPLLLALYSHRDSQKPSPSL